MRRVFISYRKGDSLAQAMALYGFLAERLGNDNIFIDNIGIHTGDHWLAKLKTELVRSDVLIVLIGPNWETAKDDQGGLRLGMPGDIVTLEVAAALERGITVIPVLLQSAKMPEEKSLPLSLKGLVLRQCATIEQVTEGVAVDNLIKTIVELPERTPEVLGGIFHLEGRIGNTRHTDIHLAVPESDKRILDFFAIQLLRQESSGEVRNWFERRCSLWQQVSHSSIADLHSGSDYRASAKTPFFAVPMHTGDRTLDSEIREAGGLERNRIVDILAIASSICEKAHQLGLLLQSLESTHFVLDASGKLRYEGFDAAMSMYESVAQERSVSRKYCIAPERLAPEAGTRKAGPTVDIFALGMLLRTMELKVGQPLSRLTGRQRRDPWAVFVFHCLCADPGGRFQNPAQFRYYLKKCLNGFDFMPDMVDLDSGRSGFVPAEQASRTPLKQIGRTPVTNIEYEHFCMETGYPLHSPDSNARRIAQRLQGPLCPVVNVSLNDVEMYCNWLSSKMGGKCRLPSEVEWMMAAFGSEKGLTSCSQRLPAINCANHFGGTTVVGAFHETRSDIGCFDMLGNVWEWCSDRSEHGTGLRALKGGSYSCPVSTISSASRQAVLRTYRASNVGFRVLKEG